VAATRPFLDRAAVDYYVAPPQVRPFGSLSTERATGSPLAVRSGQTSSWKVTVEAPVRAVGVTAASLGDATPSDARLTVILRDAAGTTISQGEQPGDELEVGIPWMVPLAGESVRPGTVLTAHIVVHGVTGLELTARGSRPAVSTVRPASDGLRLVYAEESVIYQRTAALPRARWAAASRVVTDPEERIDLLGYHRLPADEVILSEPGPAAQGKPAEVSWVHDGTDEMVLSVRAAGAGYLVLADAIQNGWRVDVDGQEATLVAADHAFAAVAIPAGAHTVRFWYPSPFAAESITGGTAIARWSAGSPAVGPGARRRRRRATRHSRGVTSRDSLSTVTPSFGRLRTLWPSSGAQTLTSRSSPTVRRWTASGRWPCSACCCSMGASRHCPAVFWAWTPSSCCRASSSRPSCSPSGSATAGSG
jgi:hypothetical protein